MKHVDTAGLERLDRFERALVYAHRVHEGQVRKGAGTPYVGHLLEVCGLVIAGGGDEKLQIAALLHDAAEDQGGRERIDDIHAQFGERVAAIVEACSDTLETPKPPGRTRKEAHIAHLHHADRGTLLVSLADKVSNVRAIVADYREQGEGLWGRFNPEADQRWYYRALADLFLERYPSRLATELDLAVADFERAMDAQTRRPERNGELAVLGIDLASARWSNVGSALLAFTVGQHLRWKSLVAPAIAWPAAQALTPAVPARGRLLRARVLPDVDVESIRAGASARGEEATRHGATPGHADPRLRAAERRSGSGPRRPAGDCRRLAGCGASWSTGTAAATRPAGSIARRRRARSHRARRGDHLGRPARTVSTIDDPRVAVIDPESGEPVDLPKPLAAALLAEHPRLEHQYRKMRGMTRTEGRLIVIEPTICRNSLARLREAAEPAGRSRSSCRSRPTPGS
jgi:hypothetical protein